MRTVPVVHTKALLDFPSGTEGRTWGFSFILRKPPISVWLEPVVVDFMASALPLSNIEWSEVSSMKMQLKSLESEFGSISSFRFDIWAAGEESNTEIIAPGEF